MTTKSHIISYNKETYTRNTQDIFSSSGEETYNQGTIIDFKEKYARGLKQLRIQNLSSNSVKIKINDDFDLWTIPGNLADSLDGFIIDKIEFKTTCTIIWHGIAI